MSSKSSDDKGDNSESPLDDTFRGIQLNERKHRAVELYIRVINSVLNEYEIGHNRLDNTTIIKRIRKGLAKKWDSQMLWEPSYIYLNHSVLKQCVNRLNNIRTVYGTAYVLQVELALGLEIIVLLLCTESRVVGMGKPEPYALAGYSLIHRLMPWLPRYSL